MVVKGSFIYDELFWGFEIIIDFKEWRNSANFLTIIIFLKKLFTN